MICPDHTMSGKDTPAIQAPGGEESMSHMYFSKRWIGSIVVLMVLVIATTSGFGAETLPVQQLNVLGTSAVHKGNLAEGRQDSVDNALAAAVGSMVMEMLTSETVVRRFQLINEAILNQRDKYVQNYRVLTESISGGTIRTLVQVDVAADRLSRDLSQLGLALSDTVYPHILFMVTETNAVNGQTTYWWGPEMQTERTVCESALATTLGQAGFQIIPLPELTAPMNLDKDISQDNMLALGNRLGADIVISGTSTARAATNTMGGNIQAFQAEVDLQAFDVQTGQTMSRLQQKAVASSQEAAVGGRQALSNVGELAGDNLVRQLMSAWQKKQARSTDIEVVVEGTSGQIASFVKLRTAINSLSGVKELKMKEMATDHALIVVNYRGSARSMADALLLRTFSGFGIDIYDVNPEAIHIRLINQ